MKQPLPTLVTLCHLFLRLPGHPQPGGSPSGFGVGQEALEARDHHLKMRVHVIEKIRKRRWDAGTRLALADPGESVDDYRRLPDMAPFCPPEALAFVCLWVRVGVGREDVVEGAGAG
ncbi:hypothetical protein FIBSPDRAFT_869563, partial [Athelia psychrophila]